MKVFSLSGGEIGYLAQHKSEVTCITLGSDPVDKKSGLVASSSKDGAVFVWRLANFEVLQEISTGLEIYSLMLPSRFLYMMHGAASGAMMEKYASDNSRKEIYLVVQKSDSSVPEENTIDETSKYKCVVYDYLTNKVRKSCRGCSMLRIVRSCCRVGEGGDVLVVANKRKIFAISCHAQRAQVCERDW